MSRSDKVAVLASGQGSNLQALLEAKVPVGLVVSDNENASALGIARAQGVPVASLSAKAFASKEKFDMALGDLLDAYKASIVVLAGFMHILGEQFCTRFAGRAINLHPSLLPVLQGLDTHKRALDLGLSEHGCSVHWLTKDLDGGKVIAQAKVAVAAEDTVQSLAAKVKECEHVLLPQVVGDILAGKVSAS